MAAPIDAVNIAQAELGNTGEKYWNWYFGDGWRYQDGWNTPYCACFLSWTYAMTPVTCPGFPRSVAIDRRDDLGGRMIEPNDLAMGDGVGFDWDGDRRGDHVGLVEDGDSYSLSIITLEGNTDGGIVARKQRNRSSVTCGVRPRYDGVIIGAGRLDVDGWAGAKTVRKWQDQLGTGSDGYISNQIIEHRKYRRNVLVCEDYYNDFALPDYYYGSELIRKVQSIVGVAVDGDWGHDTSAGIQRVLRKWGYYHGGLDSDFGHHSVESLQRSLNDDRWVI